MKKQYPTTCYAKAHNFLQSCKDRIPSTCHDMRIYGTQDNGDYHIAHVYIVFTLVPESLGLHWCISNIYLVSNLVPQPPSVQCHTLPQFLAHLHPPLHYFLLPTPLLLSFMPYSLPSPRNSIVVCFSLPHTCIVTLSLLAVEGFWASIVLINSERQPQWNRLL